MFVGVNLPSDGLVGRRRSAHRGRDHAADPGAQHAVADDAGGDDPGDARGVPPDAREDDGAVAVDGRGRARRRDPAHREPRRRGRVGRRARPPVRGRGRPRAHDRGRQDRRRAVRLHARVVRQLVGRQRRRQRRLGRLGARADELVADPQLRRDDGRPRHDRERADRRRDRAVAAGSAAAARAGRRGRRRAVLSLRQASRGTLGTMGATDTMEVFFERLNEGDVAGAVALMDERTEMRIHVGDNARTLRGVEQVGGWFLRADKGIKMIPGDVRDLGNTYQADLVVLRPGAPSQHLDAQFRVEAGKITSINLTPFSR